MIKSFETRNILEESEERNDFTEAGEYIYEKCSFKDYFSGFKSHATVNWNVRDSVWFYSYCNLNFYHRTEVLEITGKEIVVPKVFFDFRDTRSEYSDYESVNNIRVLYEIKYNGKLVAYYSPLTNVLLCCDMTHLRETLEETQFMFDEIRRALAAVEVIIPSVDKEEKAREKIDCTIGADPEFEFFKPNSRGDNVVVRASQYYGSMSNEVGCDGAGGQLELRPQSGTPDEVTDNIKKLLKRVASEHPDCDIGISGDTYPLGGHIHFGIGGEASMLPRELLRMLDDFIGEPTKCLNGRSRGGYARMSTYEKKPWGFEYRTPPATIFADPAICKIVLTIAKNLMDKYMNEFRIQYEVDNENGFPTKEAYIEFAGITEKEYKKFQSFLKRKRFSHLRTSWRVGKPKEIVKNYHVNFNSGDCWLPDIRMFYEQTLNARLTAEKVGCNIYIYGLSRDRGNDISTLPLEPLPRQNITQDHDDFHVGLAWNFRNDATQSLSERIIEKIIEEAKKYVHNRRV